MRKREEGKKLEEKERKRKKIERDTQDDEVREKRKRSWIKWLNQLSQQEKRHQSKSLTYTWFLTFTNSLLLHFFSLFSLFLSFFPSLKIFTGSEMRVIQEKKGNQSMKMDDDRLDGLKQYNKPINNRISWHWLSLSNLF